MSSAEITVTGFVANELEVRQAGEHTVVEVSVPHTIRRFDKARNEWVDAGDTTWFQATFWNDHATAVLTSLEKGSLVTMTGTAELEVYSKRDGTPGGKVKVTNPEIAVVVRRPRKGEQPAVVNEWASSGPVVDDVTFPDTETPF